MRKFVARNTIPVPNIPRPEATPKNVIAGTMIPAINNPAPITAWAEPVKMVAKRNLVEMGISI